MAIRLLNTQRIVNLASDPVSGTIGEVYYNTVSNFLKVYTGSSWTEIGSGSSLPSQTGNSGKFLSTNGTSALWDSITKTTVGLGNVENTALSTWAGSTNIATLGTVATGTWQGSQIATTYTAAKVTSVNGSTGAVTGLATTTGKLSQFAATTSAELAGVISDETGSGSLVFGTSPTLTTPNIGVATGTSFNSITGLSSTNPAMNGTVSVGTRTTVARADHVHPIDTSRAPVASPTFTGTVTAPTLSLTTADTATAATHYMVETGTDGIVRPKTLANTRTEIVTTAAVNSAAATTVGTITSGTWQGSSISTAYTAAKVTSVNSLTGAITATNILDAIKTVDGSGSGLDADLLDGENLVDNAATANTIVGRDASGNIIVNDVTGRLVRTVTGTNTAELIRANIADNDFFRILVGGTASNAGYAEISTADDGGEPIYVRQYTGAFSTLIRTATLLDASGNTNFPGALSAITKSFDIEHPTKKDMRLRYGSLEGPENGVYIRGKSSSSTITLPDYWTGLVDEDSMTVQLTSIGKHKNLYVKDISNNTVTVGGIRGEFEFFYFIQAERKDVDKLVVEY